MDGILIIDKPKDLTSFGVVAKLRKILNTKKIGHGGTLDPLATGVLPIFLGKATKIIRMICDQDKTYIAGFKLGLKTDTQDITGQVLSQSDRFIKSSQLELAVTRFNGEIQQIPPMFSANKINGVRLYDLARKGLTIERKAKNVTIKELKILNFDENTQTGSLLAHVSKGSYIRTLINDIGDYLGPGATMISLRRTKAMGFDIKQSCELKLIESLNFEGKYDEIKSKLIDYKTALKGCPEFIISQNIIDRLKLGEKIMLELKDGVYYQIYNDDDKFIGVGFKKPDNYIKIVLLDEV